MAEMAVKTTDHETLETLRIYLITPIELLKLVPPRFVSSSGPFPDVVHKEGLISIIQNLMVITTGF